MSRVILLDTGPLGLLTQRKGIKPADEFRAWLLARLAIGFQVFVPEIADYEVRRELLRLDTNGSHQKGLTRLNQFNSAVPNRYVAITTAVMQHAAELWADARKQGRPTADPKELDADVILAAQALSMASVNPTVVTTNVGHLARMVAADDWRNL
jgi:predicted nucleic acid-binding protein